MKQIAVSILLCALILFAYLKYFERKGIYYPTKDIAFTPTEAGLQYEDVYFSSRDKLRLNGWFIPKDNPRGTVLFCHGNGGNISYRLEKIILLHGAGLNVFIIDYRGYGKSQGRPSEQGVYLDGAAAYEYLVSEMKIAPEQIIPYGESLGSAAAIHLAAKNKVGALIVEGAFSRGKDMAKRFYPFLPKFLFSNTFDNLTRIKQIEAPKLFIHSKDDEIVPLALAQKLFEAAPGPKEFYQMRGGHNDAVFMAKEEYSARIDQFLKSISR